MIIHLSAKCSDLFSMSSDDLTLGDYDGYVPGFFPGEHFGDYLIMSIDTKTGKILNWPKVTDTAVKNVLKTGGR